MARIPCPYLRGHVELSDERERHIAASHPDLLPQHKQRIMDTLAAPDTVRVSTRMPSARLFSRWIPDLLGGKHVVVVVVSQPSKPPRHWVITAYVARKLAEGEAEWTRS
jgi:hypothetical protein